MDRESYLPLAVSALLAVSLHASVFYWPDLSQVHAKVQPVALPLPVPPAPKPEAPKPPEPPKPGLTPPELTPPEPTPPEPKPPEPKPLEPKPAEPEPKPEPKPAASIKPKPFEIGRDGEPIRSTVAWIPYDDFKELMAAQSLTIQPALQQQVDPVANAPVEMNPSTPKPIPTLVPDPTAAREQQDATPQNTPPTQTPSQQPSLALATANTPPSSSSSPSSPDTSIATTDAKPAAPTNAATIPQSDAHIDAPAEQHDVPQQSDTTAADAAGANKSAKLTKSAKSQIPPSSSTPQTADPAAAKSAGSNQGRSADISIPQGTGSPPLVTKDPSPDLSAKTSSADPVNQADPTDPTDPTDVSDHLTNTPAPSPTKATAQSDDSNRLALAPLKLPQKPALTQPAPSENQASRPLPPDKQTSPLTPVSPDKNTPASPAASAVKAAAAQTDSNEAKPTSVPRSDRESVATQTTPMPDRIVLGRVLVSDGIEIKTARPHINISTLYTASPRNPVATIVFDKSGQVVHAEIIRSSGFADVDSPVLNSLYRWRASGKKLQEHKSDTFTIPRMTLLFVEERKPANEQVEAADTAGASDTSTNTNPSPDSSGTQGAPSNE